MAVPLLDLRTQYRNLRGEVDAAIRRVVESQRFILGDEVEALEREMTAVVGVSHGVGVASGTDALLLALRAAGVEAVPVGSRSPSRSRLHRRPLPRSNRCRPSRRRRRRRRSFCRRWTRATTPCEQ